MNAKSKVLSTMLIALFAVTACGSAAAGASAATATSGLANRLLTLVAARSGAAANPAAVGQPAAVVPAAATPAATTSVDGAATNVDALQAAIENVYAQANPSVVYIQVSSSGNGFGYASQASGSGFVYNGNGMIVTNAHVVDGADTIDVVFADGSHQSANLIGEDTANDLAVIQVAQLPASAKPLTLAPDNSVTVGEFVAAIGSPFGEQNSMSFGIVSGLNRTMVSSGSTNRRFVRNVIGAALKNLIQTDAPINPGNSGGPLLNLSGQVIGVDNAIESASGSSSGVGFAIPVSLVRQVVPGIISSGS